MIARPLNQVTEKTDGRAERTIATRKNTLLVIRELILEGIIDPTAREIAAKAGITTRTLFRHFLDMESLRRSFVQDAEAGAMAVMDEPFPAVEQWSKAIETLIDRRVRVYESILPLYVSTVWSRHRAADHALQNPTSRRRQRLKELLPDQLKSDPILFEAIDGVLGIEYWASLRRDQGLSARRAREVLSLAVNRLTK